MRGRRIAMSKNIRYSITVDVPEGVNPVAFKSKIESLYEGMDKGYDNKDAKKCQFWFTYDGDMAFLNSKGQIVAISLSEEMLTGIEWYDNEPVSDASLLHPMDEESGSRFIRMLHNNFLYLRPSRGFGLLEIYSSLRQGDYLIDEAGYWYIFDRRGDGHPHTLCFYNPSSKVMYYGGLAALSLSAARKMTDEEKEAFDKVIREDGHKLVKEDGIYRIVKDDSPADERVPIKDCFKIYNGKPCFIENGVVTAIICGEYADWSPAGVLPGVNKDDLWFCPNLERERLLVALDKSGLKASWRKGRGAFIQPKFKQGDLVSFGPRCWGKVEGWRDGMVTVDWYLDKERGNLYEDYHQIEDSTNARLLTDGEKELLFNCLSSFGYKNVDGQLVKVPFRAEEGKKFYMFYIHYQGNISVEERIERRNDTCDRLWENGNYFRTVDSAWDAVRKVGDLLLNLRK